MRGGLSEGWVQNGCMGKAGSVWPDEAVPGSGCHWAQQRSLSLHVCAHVRGSPLSHTLRHSGTSCMETPAAAPRHTRVSAPPGWSSGVATVSLEAVPPQPISLPLTGASVSLTCSLTGRGLCEPCTPPLSVPSPVPVPAHRGRAARPSSWRLFPSALLPHLSLLHTYSHLHPRHAGRLTYPPSH